ncbi:hypothetical protein SAMN02745704_02284 [Paucidesulfovibrio gracilis DSM 16080]|uniref:Lipoprotein n=1 Tax=Paucidesulfovibrio gracilis DSM 16080 TaxID=1121449 RepID=A0A1T4XNC3_9BACT|nr:hypothetical protein [Paucidesulfovibrio gracilis]SKA91027.1 hypothetical protein SAMN02745704_02284 [Paucidesulfovibrio gracilis DSM 16080]
MRRSLTAVLLVLALAATGCATKSTGTEPAQSTSESQPTAYEQTYENPNYYYDFNDILIPRELDPVDDEKYVFDDPRFLAGFRIFSGRVVAEDVFNFFVNNMAKDNWTKKFSLKAEKSVLAFEKQNKSCTIQIEDGFKTRVTVFAIEFKDVGSWESDSQGFSQQELPQ